MARDAHSSASVLSPHSPSWRPSLALSPIGESRKSTTPLLIDEENAGTEVLCPGCGVHLVLPRELSGAEGPVVFEEVRGVRVEEELGGEAAGRKVFRLNRSGPVTLGEGVESVAVDPLRVKGTALPTRRGVESGEAMRLLAAMAVAW